MRLNEITNSTEKLELLRLIDAAIWQAFDTESLYAKDEPADDTQDKMAQSVAATPAANQHTNQNANQVAAKPIAKQPTQKPAKQLTPTQQAHVKTLNPKQLAQYIKTNLTPKPTPTPKAAPKPLNTQSTDTIGTFNPKTDMDKNKAGEPDRQA